jgi:Resolvase, N terminal domain
MVCRGGDVGCPLRREVAKLDRLSCNAAFPLSLPDAGVRFVAVDLPDMNETVVGIMALSAQAERRAISECTRAGLAAAKRRGVRLGNPNLPTGTKGATPATGICRYWPNGRMLLRGCHARIAGR